MNSREAGVADRENGETGSTPATATFGLRSTSKIRAQHFDRLAMVYVRQSSPQQVLENRESRERQYALAQFAQRLGWASERVVIVDEDQGQSGKSADNRSGFQRLMTEVSLNHVGIVLGLELSRLSRSNKDWHQLIGVCGIFNTLLCDQDGIYDALDSNDRLLLGMKGAMSEFELITLRNRLLRGSRNKAERGELFLAVPLGYLKTPSGEIVQEPDEQARGMIRLVFDKFEELGSAYAVFRYLVVNDLQLGFRRQRRGHAGDLEWKPASPNRILSILRHPIYAGAYAYGLHRAGTPNPSTGQNECERQSKNVALAGLRCSVEKRSAHGFTRGVWYTKANIVSPRYPRVARSMGVHAHAQLGRDPPPRPCGQTEQAFHLSRVRHPLGHPPKDPPP
ncbi:recombinase family protein [Singulisphaera acidiphila]|uniref:recombinase family protein n=1 Tax=Singulisphaera acidiphila TaxID=466153 RepID=UPI0006932723|nr:recombinase family protein [Singulisphaera acidiphila]